MKKKLSSVLILLMTIGGASAAPLVSEDFETNSTCFGLTCANIADLQTPVSGETCSTITWLEDNKFCSEQLPTDGFNSTGGAHLVMREDYDVFAMGWTFSDAKTGGWVIRDTVVFRFRIKFDDDFRWSGSSTQQHSLFNMGSGSGTAPHEIQFFNEKGGASAANCTPLGSGPSSRCTDAGGLVCTSDSQCDPGYQCIAPDYNSTHGGFSVKAGILTPCAGPVKVTVGTWYQVQVAVKSSITNDGFIKIWMNNNNLLSPTAEITGKNFYVDKWGTGAGFGQFWGQQNGSQDEGFIVDDFQFDTELDDAWFKEGGGGIDITPGPTLPDGSGGGGSDGCRTVGIYSFLLMAGMIGFYISGRRKEYYR